MKTINKLEIISRDRLKKIDIEKIVWAIMTPCAELYELIDGGEHKFSVTDRNSDDEKLIFTFSSSTDENSKKLNLSVSIDILEE